MICCLPVSGVPLVVFSDSDDITIREQFRHSIKNIAALVP
jgi:hypothetical protein